jgi:16S rRNA (uracil1498-N3)-methyltransferase
MRRRFYAPPEAFAPDGASVVLSSEESCHLRDVLRLRAGDEASVFDGEGREFECVVREAGGRRGGARLEVRGAAQPPRPESPLFLRLAVSLLKGEKFDLVVQKAVELGAGRIEPVLTKRSDVRLRDERDAARRVERWRRLAVEAAKQSGRARVPLVKTPLAFEALVSADENLVSADETSVTAGPSCGSLRLMFAERGGVGLHAPHVAGATRPSVVAALVGPEGGWDDEEINLARRHGWTIITLGGRTLRAETAAVVAAALLQHLFGDLR